MFENVSNSCCNVAGVGEPKALSSGDLARPTLYGRFQAGHKPSHPQRPENKWSGQCFGGQQSFVSENVYMNTSVLYMDNYKHHCHMDYWIILVNVFN